MFSLLAITVLNLTGCLQETNYQESKVPDYTLPNPLICIDETVVTDPETWRTKRRPEILELFETHVYGKAPEIADRTFEVMERDDRALDGRAIRKQVRIKHGPDVWMDLLIYLPSHASGPVPVFLAANFRGNQSIHHDPNIRLTESWCRNDPGNGIVGNRASEDSRGTSSSRWPVERILDRGYGLVTFHYGDVDPDFDDGFENGIHQLVEGGEDSRGSINAWAWGLSSALEHLKNDEPLVDGKRIAVMGHSRLGKAALWAGARDDRFALVISNNSGCGGAALFRRQFGETVKHITSSFPHWFCPKFNEYRGSEETLPVDQHMLVSLIAPRPVYIASAFEDRWADPRGEFLTGREADPVYELLGGNGMDIEEYPDLDLSVGDDVGYHVRSGGHDVKDFDWMQYLDFADRHLATEGPWRPLIDPGSFLGWHEIEGGRWNWNGNVLVGTSPETEERHGLLVTDRSWDDFEVRLQFRTLSGCSGFYFRVEESEARTGVRGFQAEIDPSYETGGLYETGGRGWVTKPDAEMIAGIYSPGEWTDMNIKAVGNHVEVRVNGVVTASLQDDPGRTEGRLALQLHGNQDLHVEFRNLFVRELDPEH